MKLSRVIPQHRRIVEFRWCKKDFMEMSPKYRAIRAEMRKPMDSCFWCQYKFKDGEMMALAAPMKGTNKILCQVCAADVLGEEVE